MSNLRRYTPTSGHGGMIECDAGGQWVRWSDVEQLQARVEELENFVNKVIHSGDFYEHINDASMDAYKIMPSQEDK